MPAMNEQDHPGETDLSFDGRNLLCGEDGVAWAAYERLQCEIIQSALLVQNIHSEVERITIRKRQLYLIRVTNQDDVNAAIDFIWRDRAGLRLKPDWAYPAGKENTSFKKWLNAI